MSSSEPGAPVGADPPADGMGLDAAVPHNRWDLLGTGPVPAPTVSVVIAHYNQPAQLARTAHALARQTVPPAEIVVADDGSAILPVVAPGGPPTVVVTQPDRGFRAAAARNLAVRHCHGDVLVFLDADTSPEPDFLDHLLRHVARSRDVVAVGRRRHADFSGMPLDADPAGAPVLDEPGWLRDGYEASRDLLDADGRSFRYVISAVLACHRRLYDEIGGFDERFVGYGGEDWDFAYRAWNAGAVLVHERDAVAWHDGPGWADRAGRPDTHDRQSLRLAALIPEPATRGAPIPHALSDVLVDVEPALPADAATTVRVVHSMLRQTFRDLRVRVAAPLDPGIEELYGPSLTTAPWTGDQLRRARARLVVRGPLPAGALAAAMDRLIARDLGVIQLVTSGAPAATLTSTRAAARAARWHDRLSYREVIEGLFGVERLDLGPAAPVAGNLAGFFAREWP